MSVCSQIMSERATPFVKKLSLKIASADDGSVVAVEDDEEENFYASATKYHSRDRWIKEIKDTSYDKSDIHQFTFFDEKIVATILQDLFSHTVRIGGHWSSDYYILTFPRKNLGRCVLDNYLGTWLRNTHRELDVIKADVPLNLKKSKRLDYAYLVKKMPLKEVQGDLFQQLGKQSIAHCVSADMHMNGGVAKVFREKLGRKRDLLNQVCDISRTRSPIGSVATLNHKGKFIFYMITKPIYWKYPTMESLKECLVTLKQLCVQYDVKKLAMPRIGCGLDRLKWQEVSKELDSVFGETDIQVTVYYL